MNKEIPIWIAILAIIVGCTVTGVMVGKRANMWRNQYNEAQTKCCWLLEELQKCKEKWFDSNFEIYGYATTDSGKVPIWGVKREKQRTEGK